MAFLQLSGNCLELFSEPETVGLFVLVVAPSKRVAARVLSLSLCMKMRVAPRFEKHWKALLRTTLRQLSSKSDKEKPILLKTSMAARWQKKLEPLPLYSSSLTSPLSHVETILHRPQHRTLLMPKPIRHEMQFFTSITPQKSLRKYTGLCVAPSTGDHFLASGVARTPTLGGKMHQQVERGTAAIEQDTDILASQDNKSG